MEKISELQLELKIKKDNMMQAYLSTSVEMIEMKSFLLGNIIAYELVIEKIDKLIHLD